MALCSSLSLLPPITSPPKLTSKCFSSPSPPNLHGIFTKSNTSTRFLLNAGFNEIEPDLNEDPRDQFATNGIASEDFEYGIYDGHHTFYEGEQEKGTFWGAIAEEITAAGPPTGFQGLISWLFPPAIAAGVYFHVPGEYLYIGAGIFTIIFCVIEMDKPDQPHHFEPQIYNMERGARDKLINDYNTMSIWDFNEKYGDLWDFTIKKDDITKR
ncbi:putative photosynthetic NDH subunit of subcomplex B 5, chloroplastic [Sesbania bispinosa]|nr:putative photosynthetic NDH subunit of subcomplex B 5, chloroplastic [Sesbania bispinosa]